MCQYKERNASRLVILERTCMRNEWKMRNSLKKIEESFLALLYLKKKGNLVIVLQTLDKAWSYVFCRLLFHSIH